MRPLVCVAPGCRMNAQGIVYSGIVFAGKRTEVGAKKAAEQISARSTQEMGTLRASATRQQWFQRSGRRACSSSAGKGTFSAASKAAMIFSSVKDTFGPPPEIEAKQERTCWTGKRKTRIGAKVGATERPPSHAEDPRAHTEAEEKW